jgi:glycosyltransferase involved in cell wall biosynthesis
VLHPLSKGRTHETNHINASIQRKNIRQVIANLPREIEIIDTIQYLVIDDGSTDNTASPADASGAQVVRHSKNRGVG